MDGYLIIEAFIIVIMALIFPGFTALLTLLDYATNGGSLLLFILIEIIYLFNLNYCSANPFEKFLIPLDPHK